jgi:hypothetical protein
VPVPASSEPAPADQPGQEIVVQARTEEAVDRFVRALTQTQRGRQLARWNYRICPRVLGLDTAHADYIVRRIGEAARRLNIGVGGPRCEGNIIVVVTSDADNFTRLLTRRYPKLFRGPRASIVQPAEIRRLLQPRPVRLIAASRTGEANGAPVMETMLIYRASRLVEPTRENAALSLLIVDSRRLDDITWGQLSDYLSLASLARPDMDSDYDSATIMSIFRMRDLGTHGPAGLTAQDRQFLDALYSSNPASTAEAQRGGIKSLIARDVRREPVD